MKDNEANFPSTMFDSEIRKVVEVKWLMHYGTLTVAKIQSIPEVDHQLIKN
jgi:hypothetical protein